MAAVSVLWDALAGLTLVCNLFGTSGVSELIRGDDWHFPPVYLFSYQLSNLASRMVSWDKNLVCSLIDSLNPSFFSTWRTCLCYICIHIILFILPSSTSVCLCVAMGCWKWKEDIWHTDPRGKANTNTPILGNLQ